MIKRRKKNFDIYQRHAAEMAQAKGKANIGRLITFGEPVSGGEFAIDPEDERWLDAFDAFENGDKSKLVALMKSGYPPHPMLLPHLGDLLDRWSVVRPKHRMRIPSHRLPDSDLKMNMACYDVDELLDEGKSLPVALAEIAAECGIKISVLREFHAHRRGPDRRVKARQGAAKAAKRAVKRD
jgi:hypothetical protein